MVIVGTAALAAEGDWPPSRMSGLMLMLPFESGFSWTPLDRWSADLLRVAKRSWSCKDEDNLPFYTQLSDDFSSGLDERIVQEKNKSRT